MKENICSHTFTESSFLRRRCGGGVSDACAKEGASCFPWQAAGQSKNAASCGKRK